MDLSVPGFDLFIAESTAQSLVGEVEVGGMLSSAFHKRHKVRESDIDTLLQLCGATPANSYARIAAIAYLLVYSSAAYAEVPTLIAADGKLLSETMVTHHFGGASRLLRIACVSEPMNLWSGWALENSKCNKVTFDPHVVSHLQAPSGTLIKVSQPSNTSGLPRGEKLTEGQKIANAYGTDSLKLQGRSAPTFAPLLDRTLTPVSGGLEKMLRNDKAIRHNVMDVQAGIVGKSTLTGSRNILEYVSACFCLFEQGRHPENFDDIQKRIEEDYQRVVRLIDYMLKQVYNMSVKGCEHYIVLKDQMNLRFPAPAEAVVQSMVAAIENAQGTWATNRNILLKTLQNAQTKILSQQATPFVQCPGGGIGLNPKTYLLGP